MDPTGTCCAGRRLAPGCVGDRVLLYDSCRARAAGPISILSPARFPRFGEAMTETATTIADRLLARLPLCRHELIAAGRRWSIDAVSDQSALLGLADAFSEFPFGLLVWESSLALADRLAAEAPALRGTEVLEIGAGVGLAGLAAAAACGARVTQTDHSPEALALCRRNAGLNAVAGVACEQADWRDWRVDRRYPLVIGADVLYDREAHGLVAAILARNVARGGRALLADPERRHTPTFCAMLRAAGWQVTHAKAYVAAITPARPGQAVAIDLIAAERA